MSREVFRFQKEEEVSQGASNRIVRQRSVRGSLADWQGDNVRRFRSTGENGSGRIHTARQPFRGFSTTRSLLEETLVGVGDGRQRYDYRYRELNVTPEYSRYVILQA